LSYGEILEGRPDQAEVHSSSKEKACSLTGDMSKIFTRAVVPR